MLVLGRKVGEKLLIGEDIVVKVLAVKGKQVRFGINTAEGVNIIYEDLAAPVNEEISVYPQSSKQI